MLCVVVSDHGMGSASDKVVHLNRFLAEAGLLVRRTSAFGPLGRLVGGDRLARGLRDTALAWLPPRLAQLIFRRARGAAALLESRVRFSGFDWRRTLAFSEEANTQPGIWINLAGREAEGCVAPADYEAVRDRVIAGARGVEAPVRRARRRARAAPGGRSTRAPSSRAPPTSSSSSPSTRATVSPSSRRPGPRAGPRAKASRAFACSTRASTPAVAAAA